MPQRIRQVAVTLQIISLLLAGGLAEGLHVLPGLGHDGHGCRHHPDARHACDEHPHISHKQAATSEVFALDECAICKLLASWRKVNLTASLQVDISLETVKCAPEELQRAFRASTHCARSRGPPVLF